MLPEVTYKDIVDFVSQEQPLLVRLAVAEVRLAKMTERTEEEDLDG